MIRKLTRADEALFLELERRFYTSEAVLHPIPEAYHRATFAELMRSEDYLTCYLFEAEGTAAGYALLSRSFSSEAGGPVIWLEELFLLPEFRGRGLGGEFFAFLFAHEPAARYRLEIEPDNVRARELYRRMGFTELPYQQMVKDTPSR